MLGELPIGLSLGTSKKVVSIFYVSWERGSYSSHWASAGKQALNLVQYGSCWGQGLLGKHKSEAADSDLGQSFLQSWWSLNSAFKEECEMCFGLLKMDASVSGQSLMINSSICKSAFCVRQRLTSFPSISLQKFCRCSCHKIPFQFYIWGRGERRESARERGRERTYMYRRFGVFLLFVFLNKKSFNLVIWGEMGSLIYLHFWARLPALHTAFSKQPADL